MAESVSSCETIELDASLPQAKMLLTVAKLKNKYFKKLRNIDESQLQEINPQNVCAELSILKSLKDDFLHSEGIPHDSENIEANILDILTKDIEEIKQDIRDTKKSIAEENEAINRMQVIINRLNTFKVHSNDSNQDVGMVTKEINKKFKEFKSYLNELMDELYTDESDVVKVILTDLMNVNPSNTDMYPYIKIKKDYNTEILEHLATNHIIQAHPESNDYFKVCINLD